MGRSVKKGPFVDAKLLSRIVAMNEKNEKVVLRTWSRASTIFPKWLVIPLRYMMEESTFRYISAKIWLDTSSASLLPPEPLKVMPVQRPRNNL